MRRRAPRAGRSQRGGWPPCMTRHRTGRRSPAGARPPPKMADKPRHQTLLQHRFRDLCIEERIANRDVRIDRCQLQADAANRVRSRQRATDHISTRRARRRILRRGVVEDPGSLLPDVEILLVLHHANDLELGPGPIVAIIRDREALPHRRTRQIRLGERLVDNCDARSSRPIPIVEIPAGRQRRAQRREIPGTDFVDVGFTDLFTVDDDRVSRKEPPSGVMNASASDSTPGSARSRSSIAR